MLVKYDQMDEMVWSFKGNQATHKQTYQSLYQEVSDAYKIIYYKSIEDVNGLLVAQSLNNALTKRLK